MSRIRQPVLVSLAMTCIAAWWGCSSLPDQHTTELTTSSASGSGGAGGINPVATGSTGGGAPEGGACTSTSAEAHRVRVDMIFLIDRSGSMSEGGKWAALSAALPAFFNDPASAGLGAGLVFLPHNPWDCDPHSFEVLDVPIDTLPGNAFALTNVLPADATGVSTPMYGALKGSLTAATAYQDAHPLHKVVLVMATDGDPVGCADTLIPDIAALAASARNYNGVLTYVIGMPGATIANLDQIAAAGGTTSAYDATSDIGLFSAKIADIRKVSLGCEFEIPPPPPNMKLDPDKVNFSYTPKGTGNSTVLLRADDLADCMGKPGWYYDNNKTPTKIILCPTSCITVQADTEAKVDVLFGCDSLIN